MKKMFMCALAALVAAGCGRPDESNQPRRYREVFLEAPSRAERLADVAAMAQAQENSPPVANLSDRTAPGAPPVAAATVSVRWTTPEGWVERPGNPMRIMTFEVGPDRAECTLTAFPGSVGGLEGNLARWANQIHLTLPPETLARFARTPTTFETDGGFPCLVYDFADVAPEADLSMLAAILPLDGRTLFVKLTGSRDLLAQQKSAFLALCRSLAPESP